MFHPKSAYEYITGTNWYKRVHIGTTCMHICIQLAHIRTLSKRTDSVTALVHVSTFSSDSVWCINIFKTQTEPMYLETKSPEDKPLSDSVLCSLIYFNNCVFSLSLGMPPLTQRLILDQRWRSVTEKSSQSPKRTLGPLSKAQHTPTRTKAHYCYLLSLHNSLIWSTGPQKSLLAKFLCIYLLFVVVWPRWCQSDLWKAKTL